MSFWGKINQHRGSQNLSQRQISMRLAIDTMWSGKIVCGERRTKKEQMMLFANFFNIDIQELLTLCLAKDEDMASRAMEVAEENLSKLKKPLK